MSVTPKQSTVMIGTVIVSAIVMRLVPHIPNFAPITAAALFAAAYLPRKYALLVPLAAIAVSDYLLLYINPFSPQIFNFSQIQPLSAMVNPTTLWVWGSFMVSGLLGLALQKHRSVARIGAITVLASLQFYLITNFGVWAAGSYARDLSGLATSLIAGLPFLRWTLLGDLFYAASFFGVYALATKPAKATTAQQSRTITPASI